MPIAKGFRLSTKKSFEVTPSRQTFTAKRIPVASKPVWRMFTANSLGANSTPNRANIWGAFANAKEIPKSQTRAPVRLNESEFIAKSKGKTHKYQPGEDCTLRTTTRKTRPNDASKSEKFKRRNRQIR
jgi:hypothetical protein